MAENDPLGPLSGEMDLDDTAFELAVLFADGELASEPVRLAQAEALLAQSAAARAIVADLQATKAALREAIVGESASAAVCADMSMTRGRVMTRLPVPPRSAVVADAAPAGWMGWLRQLGLSKVGLAFGAAVAVAAWLVVAYRPAASDPQAAAPAVAGELDLNDHLVIIEEMEVDGESVTVTPGDHPGKPTVIWHFDTAKQGEG